MTILFFVSIFAALLIDRLYGDPKKIWSTIPHPVVLFGKLIAFATDNLNHGTGRQWKGTAFVGVSCILLAMLGVLISSVPLGEVMSILLAAILLAHKALIDHVKDVAEQLRVSDARGRMAVAHLVGRDTGELDSSEIAKAAVESAAEGFSDGVVAPCFWFLILGPAGILIYKFVNTADSMIGYRNAEFAQFGWAAARFDDLLNWIPARLSALLLLLTGSAVGRFSAVMSDARLHESPNAGWPEAATAHILDLALGGRRSYQGEIVDLPTFNSAGRELLTSGDIDDSVHLINQAHSMMMRAIGMFIIIWLIF